MDKSEPHSSSPNLYWLPYLFLSMAALVSWISTAILLFLAFARGRRFGNRLARYVLRVVALIVLIFAIVLIFGWTWGLSPFKGVCERGGGVRRAALIVSHLTLFFGILTTLLAAILDFPRDPPGPPPSGATTPPTRRPSRTGGAEV
ncbi:hypothetical protein FZEAL_3974 [Fusarium zealandicum]|uniref:Uncharacterized protein n=1 Tax=Fusarium zealandicum TaxID=1053134 RepID=A0A8H4UNB3_9HYPO|nr:hypothetical protein FZEAL_3974 [Fusarium zealandicum]